MQRLADGSSLRFRYRQRHVAIQIQYEGEPFYGFTSQTGGCEETVEKHIFEALLKLRLITDKHVRNFLVMILLQVTHCAVIRDRLSHLR